MVEPRGSPVEGTPLSAEGRSIDSPSHSAPNWNANKASVSFHYPVAKVLFIGFQQSTPIHPLGYLRFADSCIVIAEFVGL